MATSPNPSASQCETCEAGFPAEEGLHLPSQSKGMIPLTVCRNFTPRVQGCPECFVYVGDDEIGTHIEQNLSNYDYHFPEFVNWKCRSCGHRFAMKVEGELEAIPSAHVRRVVEVLPDDRY